jgi:hypothetical protein
MGSRKIRLHKAAPAAVSQHDLVWGAKAIGECIGRSERVAFWLLETKAIPGVKVGKRWCASRARLLAACAGEDVS